MKIVLLTAMDIEYRHVVAMLGGHAAGIYGAHEVVVAQSGMGKVNAALAVQRLIVEQHPDCVISTGLAGRLAASLQVGDMVVGRQCAYHDVWCGMGNVWGQVQGMPARFEADAHLLDCARQVAAHYSGSRCVEGLIATGDFFVDSAEKVAEILQRMPDALVCEMESTAIAHTCHLLQVPFMAVRLVSDTPDDTDDHALQWNTFLQTMSDRSFQWIQAFLQKL